jgi:hypothetical protein
MDLCYSEDVKMMTAIIIGISLFVGIIIGGIIAIVVINSIVMESLGRYFGW